MKTHSVLVLLASVLLSLACSQDNTRYSVRGTAPEDGRKVYLLDMITTEPINSTVVSGGTFKMDGRAAKDAYLSVSIENNDWWFPFFNDGTPVQVSEVDSLLSGSALNNKLTDCDKRNSDAYAEYSRVIEAFEALPVEEQLARADEFGVQYRAAIKKYTDFYMDLIEENMDNLIPVVFIEEVPSLAGKERFNELLASDAPFTKHPYVIELKRHLDESVTRQTESEKAKQTIVGQKFLDLEEADPDGAMHKLSEFAGRGKWVLVDFWASWCGPCRAEMPNVVAEYKKYHAKGFEVVGLSFDQEKDPWVKAIKEWDMPWIHLSDLKYWKTVAAGVYNVNSIPDNLLIDPQGTVVARGLRGAALESRLAEIFK